MRGFFEELRYRNVFRVAVAYVIAGWLIAQVADLAADAFNAPEWFMQMLIVLLLIGLPVALFLAWAYLRRNDPEHGLLELLDDGLRRGVERGGAGSGVGPGARAGPARPDDLVFQQSGVFEFPERQPHQFLGPVRQQAGLDRDTGRLQAAQPVAGAGDATTYTDTGLTDGEEYCYKVTASDGSCESGYSNILCAVPTNVGQAVEADDRLFQKIPGLPHCQRRGGQHADVRPLPGRSHGHPSRGGTSG